MNLKLHIHSYLIVNSLKFLRSEIQYTFIHIVAFGESNHVLETNYLIVSEALREGVQLGVSNQPRSIEE